MASGKKQRVLQSKQPRKIVRIGLIVTGLLTTLAVIAEQLASHWPFEFSPKVLMDEVDQRSLLAGKLVQGEKKDGLDGKIKQQHPRIFLPFLAGWDPATGTHPTLKTRLATFKKRKVSSVNPCVYPNVMARAACWILTPTKENGDLMVKRMFDFYLKSPAESGYYGNAWQLAFAYDLGSLYPGFSAKQRQEIQSRLKRELKKYIRLLEGDDLSLWHGRASMAANAFLIAVILDTDLDDHKELLQQSQRHFLDVMAALELTEGWPEGFSYWINNRALVLALAAGAYLNGLSDTKEADRIKEIMRRTGHWHIYATRPDHRVEHVGDEGARVDLKDITRPYIDFVAQMTEDPFLTAYSQYLLQAFGGSSYHDSYRWAFRLFNEPKLLTRFVESPSLKHVGQGLPRFDIFGKGAFNLGYIRSDWTNNATYISFRAGHNFTHHGHYDAGHFTLFKGEPLAVNSSSYTLFDKPNRLNYALRTVAKNSLLILRPGEHVQPNKLFKENIAAGGQRLTMPTGSAVRNIKHWYQNLYQGAHWEGGVILQQDSQVDFDYVLMDLTAAYNNTQFDDNGEQGKVWRVTRELLYLRPQDRLLVHDFIHAVKPNYRKKWLLHTLVKPEVSSVKVIKGQKNDGIMLSDDNRVLVKSKTAQLTVDRIFPIDAKTEVIGGPHYRFYADSDGDGATYDGKNQAEGASSKPWFDQAQWRLGFVSSGQQNVDQFLVSLTPRLKQKQHDYPALKSLLAVGQQARAVLSGDRAVVFVAHEMADVLAVKKTGQAKQLLIVGLAMAQSVDIQVGTEKVTVMANSAGVVKTKLPHSSDKILIFFNKK
ncbi:heparinase II/III family protein [Zooshikella marina]|uniref:heparinase II/III family protein n=1 Tax=Zooshikella ganghwensis TaxID=202772 RepID=UPI001BAED113|nr:heparinase II/III family protein [Zooshikella ganghwensis]MBU2704418.1 heparinase II/III family protein [Zooshikella ganghwensis]